MDSTLFWFRRDLRLQDNPAFTAAVARGGAVIPVFIWSPGEAGKWAPGAASRWWLHQSLKALDLALRKKNSALILRKGESLSELKKLLQETQAKAIYFNRRYEPSLSVVDQKIEASLRHLGIEVKSFNSTLLFEPDEIKNKSGNPFKVFTPFWKACLKMPLKDLAAPLQAKFSKPKKTPESLPLEDLELDPKIHWTEGIRQAWQPGEKGAEDEFEKFLHFHLAAYLEHRDRPDRVWTSRLSPHLHFGEISPCKVWYAVRERSLVSRKPGIVREAEGFLRQMAWREFAYHLLYFFPHTAERPLRPEFEKFPWRSDPSGLKAWQQGRTGYPLVDAGMRELWTTGWMHNRLRMVVASFLVKDLLIPWQEGAKWFWDTLVDADLANNTLGWQWTAGCGADAAPYFRIFNPVTQGKKFDPKGDYVRRWVPELAKLSEKWIHRPWSAPGPAPDYPPPVVDHGEARARALVAFRTLKKPNR